MSFRDPVTVECILTPGVNFEYHGGPKSNVLITFRMDDDFHQDVMEIGTVEIRNVSRLTFRCDDERVKSVKIAAKRFAMTNCLKIQKWIECPFSSHTNVCVDELELNNAHINDVQKAGRGSFDVWDLQMVPNVRDHLALVHLDNILNTKFVSEAREVTIIGISGLINLRGFANNHALESITVMETPYALPHITCLTQCASLKTIVIHHTINDEHVAYFRKHGVNVVMA